MRAEFKYWAFISYSHADKKWGDWLHRALETYKVPKPLAGAVSGSGKTLPRRIFPIFRDREELPTSSDLGSMITHALEQSHWLIVICSPRAAKSRWVNQEILDFKRLGGAECVLALIVGGEPNAAEGKPGFSAEAECFPEALRYALGASGNLDKSKPTEPIAADARPGMDGKVDALLKLAAGILGINYDDLRRRDERRRRRQQRIVVAVSTALVLSFAGLAALALWQWRQSVSQRLAAQAQLHISDDNVSALREAVQAAELRHTVETEFALNAVMSAPRERYVLRHRFAVHAAAFSRDGKRIVTASDDNTARVWNAEDGHLLFTLLGHAASVNSAAFSPDGKRIVTASKDKTARIWDADNGRPLATLSGNTGEVETATFSPDGKLILTVTSYPDNEVRLWDAADGHPLDRDNLFGLFFTFHKSSATFSPDGKRIVTIDSNGLGLPAVEWNVENGQPVAHFERAWSAAFSPDGKRIATAELNVSGGVNVWDADNGHLLFTLNVGPMANSIAFSPDGKRMIVINQYVSVQVWDLEDGHMLANLSGPANQIRTAEFSLDGKRIVTSSDRTVRVWDAEDGHLLGILSGHTDTVNSATFSPDGMHVLTASNDDTARIWDLEDGRLVANLSAGVAVQTAEFSPDGKTIATASANDDHSMAQVWDAGSGKLLRTLPEQKAMVTTAVFSPTGTRLVTANNNGTAQVWNAADGRPLLALQGYSAAFSPSGRQIVTALGVGLDLWDAENGRLLATLSDELPGMISEPPSPDRISVSTGAFSPDGKRIVAVTGGVTLWQDGHLANAGLDGDVGDKAYSAAFSPDGKRVVVASGSDHTARVWDANAEGRLLATLSGHTDEVLDAAFSPDGKRIITASKDRTARVWDATTDSPLATFSGHTDKVSTAKFSRDGKRIVTASADGTAKVYLVDFDELLKRAKQDLPINRGN